MATPIRTWLSLVLHFLVCVQAWPSINLEKYPDLPPGGPQPVPAYMVSNVNNQFGVAPDKGTINGPVTSEANRTLLLKNKYKHAPTNATSTSTTQPEKRQDGSFWLGNLAQKNSMPFAPSGYVVYRNVKDYGAVGDGVTDDTIAINKAVSDGDRCGEDCGSTTTLGAVIYFPPGIYLISSPIIQYYLTQFIGDANSIPIIRGSADFTGIALIDTDVYIPEGDGAEWYINQNNFLRQIRNFNFDMSYMNATIYDNDQEYAPTGIHWQVAQAASLQNLAFNMPVSTATQSATAVGIFMENGSGGFLSDIVFYGGNVGFRAGSQQYTARSLTFTNCLTAISTIWDWGFTWSQITINNCYVALNVSSNGGSTSQGTGSIAIIDSTFNHVPYGITTHSDGDPPAIILDNLLVQSSDAVVMVSGGETILAGSPSGDMTVDFWAMGRQYTKEDGTGSYVTGHLDPAPSKPASLLTGSGQYYFKARPQYETTSASGFVVATDNGVSNDGTGDQAAAINSLLSANVGKPIFFPGGVYQVQSTVNVPVGSIIVGSLWSQIMGTGSYFEDVNNPKVMVKVGNVGDEGVIEISDMMFTVKGATAGAILMEWNVHESTQGSAAMWDSHFRVGGAKGTNLQVDDCPTLAGVNNDCIAASMLLHVTSKASGYFENVWAWVADHDLDNPANADITEGDDGIPKNVHTQISIYAARGILIESQGPCWFYGTASEHSTLYQYQLNKAANIFLGHIQTESPYYQPAPLAPKPFSPGAFSSDPTFDDCTTDSCKEAWALRIVDSSNIMIYSAGLYSWFSNYDQSCVSTENCQDRVMRVENSEDVWLFNVFTKGAVEIASEFGSTAAILQDDSNQSGYTTEVNVWRPLGGKSGSGGGSGSGGDPNDQDFGDGDIVYVYPDVWTNPEPTIGCVPPCTLLFPPFSLQTPITVSWPPYATGVYSSSGDVTVTITTFITIAPFTLTEVDFWPVTINSGDSEGEITPIQSITPPYTVITFPNGIAPIGVTETPGTNGVANYTAVPPNWAVGPVTIQPQPTISIPIPQPTPETTTTDDDVIVVTSSTRSVSFTKTQTGGSTTCTSHCGKGSCGFGCNGGCGPFGCNGGCGIFGCGGGGCGLNGCGGGSRGGGGGGTNCGPSGCGCDTGCGCKGCSTDNNGGGGGGGGSDPDDPDDDGGCVGPTCPTPGGDDENGGGGGGGGDEGCEGDDCGCEATKTVTSCGVRCTKTFALTTTITGTCSTTTCITTSCGTDTTRTRTTTITSYEEIELTEVVSDIAYTDPLTDDYVASFYNVMMSWISMEDSGATITAPEVPILTSITATPPDGPGITLTQAPKPTQSTGLVVAAYTADPPYVPDTFYQWELYPLKVSGTSTVTVFPGCSTADAMYSSVVHDQPFETSMPKLGPFDIDGKTSCYFDKDSGVTCDGEPVFGTCLKCQDNKDFCKESNKVCGEGEGYIQYHGYHYCFW